MMDGMARVSDTTAKDARPMRRGRGTAYWQAAPFALLFLVFFIVPLVLTVAVSFWRFDDYVLSPDLNLDAYREVFEGCISKLPSLCVTFATYLSTLRFALMAWATTLVLGFGIAYFLAFQVRSVPMQMALFLLCTVPFWTSNIIRMVAWVPLLGRNGLVNQGLQAVGLTQAPLDWLLYSEFSVVLAFVHLYTLFMMVPIFNSMARIDRSLIEAARDAGASGWQTLWNVVIPLCKPGIVIGSIFVLTIVMGDFVTVGIMGGQQIASIGKVIQVQMSYLQFPIAAANAVVLLGIVLLMIWALTRLVDIRREL